MLRAASNGDAAARASFAQDYTSPIRAYLAHRWRGTALAEGLDDAVQDVFVECMKPGGVLERAEPERGEFRALLYGVARNVARRAEERAPKLDRESVHLDDLPAQQEALSRVFDRAWAQSLLREAVLRHAQAARSGDEDSRRRYRVLRMRHQQGMPVRAIAKALDEADVDAVHNAYRRARREFRAFLREVVARHTGAPPQHLDVECRRVTELLGS